jgi:RNA polymerase sigma-70 factor, ECF subfamily
MNLSAISYAVEERPETKSDGGVKVHTSIMSQNSSDEQLAKKSVNDLDAFAELIGRYEEKLIRYILRISNIRTEEAEEILQEVFLKAWKNINDFDPSLKFSSWIYRITHNETISHHRKRTTRGEDKKISIDDALFQVQSKELPIPEQLDQKLRAKQVHDAIDKMDEKYKEILILRYFEDKSYEEISDILKRPSGTVATLISRAKKQFEQKLITNSSSGGSIVEAT